MVFLGLDQVDTSERSILSNTGASLGVEGTSSDSDSGLLNEGDLGRWKERRGDIAGIGGGDADGLRSAGCSIRDLTLPFDGDSSSTFGNVSRAPRSDKGVDGLGGETAASTGCRFMRADVSEAVLSRRGISIRLI